MKKPKRDLLIHHPSHEGAVIRVKKTGEVSFGSVIKQEEGEPINGEIIAVHKTPMSPMIDECETLFDPSEYTETSSGPPKANSRAFRDNWERIFGSPDSEELLN